MRLKRGLVLNLISNVLFFLCGYVVHFFLGNTLPAAEYGVVGTIMTVLDFEYMFLSNGARQSIAKEISLQRFDIRDIIMKSLGFQMMVIAVFFIINFAGAPVFGHVLNDSSLDFYFKVAAFLIPANGLFVLLLGINDGLHRFSTGAIINTVYPIAKLCVIPLIIFWFQHDPVLGMEIGYLVALLVSIALGLVLLIPARDRLRERRSEKIAFSSVCKNTLSFSFFFIMVSLVLSIDTLVVKSVVEPASMAGFYTGAVNLGKIPYYLVSAFCTIILPVVAKSVGAGDRDGALNRVKEFITLIATFILPIPVLISASSRPLLQAFYHEEYGIAGTALACLAFSSFFMGMTVLLNMVFSSFSSGHFSDLLSVASLVVVIPLFIVSAKFGGISAIAIASVASTFVTMGISYFTVISRTGNIITRKAWITIGANAILWVLLKIFFTVFHIHGLFLTAGVYAIVYLCYLGILFACRVLVIPNTLFHARKAS
ncbi:MAG: oligosaccharide flippase family protein [Bifidobacterium psychraerophilum]|uniref:lipopolysaccharide biosynthesis protein n=1 Tax=Bifidobacterium psychraerophilum TaxID=218140 RepID=UPI0023F7D3EB|nr:oligosaccharide flippase family protein [Bifidobacterium psychraerophilum]MCI2177222.1 oligosaccharide flippase family protein [Bifidobacterium psychraerophilum]MCI2182373.1 oligosaccharide flippase family protein [Bifidobacterium psychraerophilum]